jgi:hypothetical protein
MNTEELTESEATSRDSASNSGERDDVPSDRSVTSTPNDITEKWKKKFDVPPEILDLIFFDFQEAFELNPDLALKTFLALLLEPTACQMRCVFLEEAGLTEAGQKWAPAGNLHEVKTFLRELTWLAHGQLGEAVKSGEATVEHLVQLASHPKALLVASQVLMEGETALSALKDDSH